MNVHIKTIGQEPYSRKLFEKIVSLIDKYDCRKYVYFMTNNLSLLGMAQELAPDIVRCVGYDKNNPDMVETAVKYDCKKIQLFKPHFNQDMIDRAHKAGVRCNVFWSDDPKEAVDLLKMGIDTILTNDYNRVAQAVENYKNN